MIQTCVIGNSHIAALKVGWESIKTDFPEETLTFFGAPGLKMNGLRPFEGSLVTDWPEVKASLKRTSQGKSQIDSALYDRFIVCGMRYSIDKALQLYDNYRTEPESKDDREPISLHCFMRAIEDNLRASVAIRTVEKLRAITHSPIALIPAPLRSEDSKSETLKRIYDKRSPQYICDLFARISDEFSKKFAFRLFPQPEMTKATPFETKSAYSRELVRLVAPVAADDDDEDFDHMNAEYGAIVLRAVLSDAAWRSQPARSIGGRLAGSLPSGVRNPAGRVLRTFRKLL
jgi:hypothetical protein